MLRLFLTRASVLIPTILGVMLVTFVMIRLPPGDPIEIRAGERGVSAEELTRLRHNFGLDRPVWEQFVHYVKDVAQGDFGTSIATRRPVWEEFMSLFPATAELGICAIIFAIVFGIPLGALAASTRGSPIDYGLVTVSVLGASMPIFWWGLMAIMVFSVMLGWTPVSGRLSDIYFIDEVTGFMLIDTLLAGEREAFWSAAGHLVLPTIVLGTLPLATIARMTRSSMLEVLGEDYIRTARSKGVGSFRLIFVHALRNALIPIVTVIGLQIGTLCGGAILTETIFAWPGVGRWLVESIQQRDYVVLQGGTLLIAILVICLSLAVDLSYGIVDPRMRRR